MENIRELDVSEARRDTGETSSVGLQAALFVVPVRQRREAPAAALVLARSRNRNGGRAHRTGGRRCVMMSMF